MEDKFTNVVKFPEKNWEVDYNEENGCYQNRCLECKELFMGHKRRVICKECAEKPIDWEKLAEKKPPTQHESWAWQGCWADGEMTGFARCVVKKVKPLETELASLREQLKQKEEVIRELIPIAEVGQAYYRQNPGFNWAAEREKSKAIIKQEQIYELVKRKDILFLEVKQVNQDLLKALEMLLDHVTEDTMNTNWSDVIKLTKDAIAKSKKLLEPQ